MEELKRDILQIKKAVFGDDDNRKNMPGLVSQMDHLERSLSIVTESVTGMKNDTRKVVWMVLVGVIGAVLTMVLKR